MFLTLCAPSLCRPSADSLALAKTATRIQADLEPRTPTLPLQVSEHTSAFSKCRMSFASHQALFESELNSKSNRLPPWTGFGGSFGTSSTTNPFGGGTGTGGFGSGGRSIPASSPLFHRTARGAPQSPNVCEGQASQLIQHRSVDSAGIGLVRRGLTGLAQVDSPQIISQPISRNGSTQGRH